MTDHHNPDHKVEDFKAFYDWLNAGVEQKFISMPYCDAHDGAPLEDWEKDLWDAGTDPCMSAVRLLGPYAPNELQRDQAIADGTITAREAK
jgi:hypothetical protein